MIFSSRFCPSAEMRSAKCSTATLRDASTGVRYSSARKRRTLSFL